MLLYLTSNQKSNLIDPAVRNMTLPAKKLVGRFSLKSFVTKDMRNYANAKFFVVDAACIEESGNDFTLALQSFQMMFSARIIVILSGYEDVNGEVQRLLSIGVVNLVTGETMEDALDELTEALSEDGMQRYVVKAPVYEQPATQREKAPEPDEIIPYRWNARNIRIAVAGSQRRSGVTVTAFNLASWLAARGAEVAYIEVNQNRHLQLLLNIYEAAPDGEHYTIDGIDCYLTNEPDKAYQFKIELVVLLTAFYGLRRSEVIGLKWSAFDFNHNCFSIRHTVTTCNVKGERVTIKKDKAKNKSSLRTYPLIPFLKERLLEAKKQQEENRKLCGRAYNKEYLGYVCVDVIGNLIKPNYVSSTFGKLLAKNNLRHIRFHDLRHTCASLLLANGVPMEQVKEWLGHSEISTTVDIYGHLQYATKKQSAAAIEQDIVAPMLQNLSAVSP